MTIIDDTTLTENHEGNIIIGADDITLDCDGRMVLGSGLGFGIDLNDRTGVTVKNCHVEGFGAGFGIQGSASNNTLRNNMAKDNGLIALRGGSGFQVSGSNNTFEENSAHG